MDKTRKPTKKAAAAFKTNSLQALIDKALLDKGEPRTIVTIANAIALIAIKQKITKPFLSEAANELDILATVDMTEDTNIGRMSILSAIETITKKTTKAESDFFLPKTINTLETITRFIPIEDADITSISIALKVAEIIRSSPEVQKSILPIVIDFLDAIKRLSKKDDISKRAELEIAKIAEYSPLAQEHLLTLRSGRPMTTAAAAADIPDKKTTPANLAHPDSTPKLPSGKAAAAATQSTQAQTP